MTGSSDTRPFKNFQIRWAEKLGDQTCPYLIRWTFIFFGRSIRLHHWIRSDDRRHFHDHSADLTSIVLKGKYWNVVPYYRDNQDPDPNWKVNKDVFATQYGPNSKAIFVRGLFDSLNNLFKRKFIWHSTAQVRHYLEIHPDGAWTLLFEGKKYHKWGFYVKGVKYRPLRYFHKFGIIQTKDYK
jgi:hypothetical protein